MAVGTLASAVVMGLFLVAVAVLVGSRGWYAYTPSVTTGGEAGVAVAGAVDDPAWWTAGFLLLVAVFGGGAVALVSGAVSPAAAPAPGRSWSPPGSSVSSSSRPSPRSS